MALKVNVPIGGTTTPANPQFTPGVNTSPKSPGESPNMMHTPDCPKGEADMAGMQKK